MTTKPEELMPCPWCGSTNLVQSGQYAHHMVSCLGCDCDGPEAATEEAATTVWNTRHFGSPYRQEASNEIGASAQVAPTEASEPTIHNDGASIKPAG